MYCDTQFHEYRRKCQIEMELGEGSADRGWDDEEGDRLGCVGECASGVDGLHLWRAGHVKSRECGGMGVSVCI